MSSNDFSYRSDGARAQASAFLDSVGKEVANLASPDDIMRLVGERIGNFLEVSGCIFADVDEEKSEVTIHSGWTIEGVPSLKQTFRLRDYLTAEFQRASRAGEDFIVRDTAHDTRADAANYAKLRIGAFVVIPTFTAGRWTGYFATTNVGPRDWRPPEIEFLRDASDRLFTRLARARAEQALQESEARYRLVVEGMDTGFVVMEVVRGERNRVVDLHCIEANAAMERETGLAAEQLLGKRLTEVLPREDAQFWIDTAGGVVDSQNPVRVEHFTQSLGRWFAANMTPFGPERVAVVTENITDRKLAELTLKESERHKAFLLRFSDALRNERDEDSIANRALQMLIDEMQADRCHLSAFRLDEGRAYPTHYVGRPDLPPLPTFHNLADYPASVRQMLERTAVVEDAAADPALSKDERRAIVALGKRAFICSTVRRGENNPIWAVVVMCAQPRKWTPGEVHLVEQVTERTWAAIEQARADARVRESEERLRQFARASSAALWIRNADTLAMEFASPAVEKLYGIELEQLLGDVKHCLEVVIPEDRDMALRMLERAKRGEYVVLEFRIRRASDQAVRLVRSTGFPLLDEAGHVQRIGGIAEDVTDSQQ